MSAMGDGAKLDDQSLLQDGRGFGYREACRGSPARPSDIKLPCGLPRSAFASSPGHYLGPRRLVSAALLSFLPAFLRSRSLVLASSVLSAHQWRCVHRSCYSCCRFHCSSSSVPLDRILQVPCAATRETWHLQAAYTLPTCGSGLRLVSMRASRAAMLPVFTTLYLPPWMRLLGAKIGKYSEMSTIFSFLPELLSAGDGSFFADGSITRRAANHIWDSLKSALTMLAIVHLSGTARSCRPEQALGNLPLGCPVFASRDH